MFKKLRTLFFWQNQFRQNQFGQNQESKADDELRFHLEKEVEQNIARGMAPAEARRQALIVFGGVQQTRESLREVHRGRLLESFLQDVRF